MNKLCFMLLLFCVSLPAQVYESESNLCGKVIILDAGHGIGSPGGVVFNTGYVEHRRMFVLAEFLRDELISRGAIVHMTRTCPMDVAIPVRAALMNRWSIEALLSERLSRLKKGDVSTHESNILIEEIDRLRESLDVLNKVIHNHTLYAPIYLNYPFDYTLQTIIHPSWRQILEFQSDPLIRYNWLAISLHSNGNSNPNASGADVFFSANNNPRNRRYFAGYSHEDITELFGRMLLDGIAPLGLRPNRVRMHHFMMIRETNIPAVLAENGYHTNYHDRRLLQDDNFMRRLAVAYADTIEAYFAHINNNNLGENENLPIVSWFTRSLAIRFRTQLAMRFPLCIPTDNTFACVWHNLICSETL